MRLKPLVLLILLLSVSSLCLIQPSEAGSLVIIKADQKQYNNLGCADYIYMDAWNGYGIMGRFPNYVYLSNRRSGSPPVSPYTFTIYRSFLAFNTSELDGLKVNWVRLWLKRSYYEDIDSSWILKVQNWTDGADGVEVPDEWWEWDGINYDDGKAVLTNWAANGDWDYVKISDLSVINQAGYTYLCLRCNKDVEMIEPTGGGIAWWWQNNATYLPYLEVKVSGKPLALIQLDSLSLGLPTFFVIVGLVVIIMKSEERRHNE